jgi:hypothetical protein
MEAAARKPLVDLRRYARELSGDPRRVRSRHRRRLRQPRRVVFAEGEEEKVVPPSPTATQATAGRC